MRQLLQIRAIRSLCYALVLALVSTILPAPFAQQASAQLMPQYSVGVVDFVNESGVQGDLLARIATDAVVVEMSKTNRYDVSITRTMMKTKMDELGLRPPHSKLDLVRLGEVLSADAMLQGAIKSVQLAGNGPTRRASVSLVVQMIDQASGEIINGAVQTGTSSAHVGYTADDNALITEAVNGAAFLAVKTMIDYVIPEATVMMNIGDSKVMINKGVRDGIKPGMRMIVLRDKEIIGYLDITSADPTDAYAKVIKSMRGIQPQDKVRAIFEMPTISTSLKSEPLPSGAPSKSRVGGGAASKIGKFLLGAAIVFGVVSIFKGGNGSPDPPSAGTNGPMVITWNPKLYTFGDNLSELQIIRDQDERPVRVINSPGPWNMGSTDLTTLYGTNVGTAVSYNKLPLGATTPTAASWTVPAEGYGQTHQYQLCALVKKQTGISTEGVPSYGWDMTKFGSLVIATAVEPVQQDHIIMPLMGDPVLVSQLRSGEANLRWGAALGADQYCVTVEPVVPNTGPTWQSSIMYYGSGSEVALSDNDRLVLASLLSNPLYVDKEMKWRVDCRHLNDTQTLKEPTMKPNIGSATTAKSWTRGAVVTFTIGGTPGGPP